MIFYYNLSYVYTINFMIKELNSKINKSTLLLKKLKKISLNIKKAIDLIYFTIDNGNKIYICGNGGSAADAQHLAAEFMVRLRSNVNRKPYPVISLALDTSTLTACSNDYSYKKIFSRSLESLYSKGDILIILSTSGNSKNIIDVLKFAKKNEIKTVSFLGGTGGKAIKFANTNLLIPSKNVANIQECHIFLGHFIFEQVENKLIKKVK